MIGLAKVLAKEGAEHSVTANVVCPGFARTPLVDKQIPEHAQELGISEEQVVKSIMLNDTVDGEFTSTDDVEDAVLYFASSKNNALTGQSLVVSHGWFMQQGDGEYRTASHLRSVPLKVSALGRLGGMRPEAKSVATLRALTC